MDFRNSVWSWFLKRNSRYARRMIKRRFDGPILSRDERFSPSCRRPLSAIILEILFNRVSRYWIRIGKKGNRAKK